MAGPSQCPACESTQVTQIHFADGIISTCKSCKLEWATKPSSHQDLSAFDVTTVHDHYMNPANMNPATYEPYISFFKRIETDGPGRRLRILDVGCGNGAFVGECLWRGHDAYGVEIDPAKRSLQAPSVRDRITIGAIEDAAISDGTYDIITFWDSFEHIQDPFGLLSRCSAALQPGGAVFLRVNNSNDILNFLAKLALILCPPVGRRLAYACFNFPQHFWNFNATAMNILVDKRGWRTVWHRATETPSSRLTGNPVLRFAIEAAYLVNRMIGGGKIGEYLIAPGRN